MQCTLSESRPEIFYQNKLGGGGGGGCNIYISYVNFRNLCFAPGFCCVPFNHDKAKLVQDQISLPASNMEQAELPLHQYYQCLYRSVFTSALFEFKCCYGSTALAQSTFRVCIHKVVQNCP